MAISGLAGSGSDVAESVTGLAHGTGVILLGWISVAVLAVILAIAVARHAKIERGLSPGIISMALTGTGRGMYSLLSGWGVGRLKARLTFRADVWIIISYSVGLAIFALLSSQVVRDAGDGWVTSIGVIVAYIMMVAALVAGWSDLRENRLLVEVLDIWSEAPQAATPDERQHHRRQLIKTLHRPSAQARSWAVTKFSLIGICLSWALVVATIWLARTLAG